MQALRKIVKAQNHTITIKLPAGFSDGHSFEIIILPTEEKNAQNKSTEVSRQKRKAGLWKGQIIMSDDFNAPLEDFKEYMK